MIASLKSLLADIVDYAGLFPPAKLPMDESVQQYAAYLTDPHRFMLGRFVVPAVRLDEFDGAAAAYLPTYESNTPWLLSALMGPDLVTDARLIEEFNVRHRNSAGQRRVFIDSVELRAATLAEIENALRKIPAGVHAFIEVPIDEDPTKLIEAIGQGGAKAKVRTGGITTDAFPPPSDVARFIEACRDLRVGFKATAGLHHPVRAEYRLTYEPDPPFGMMYGYLNVFGAALIAWSGAPGSLILDALTETDIKAFSFDEQGMTYRGLTVPNAIITEMRSSFAASFGSCSFREPVDDLTALGL